MLQMANIHITKRNGIILSYRGHRYCKNRTTQENIHRRCMVRCCLAPLQSNIFSNNQDVRVLSVGTHNHNTASYTKNDCKEIKQGNHVAPKSLLHEKRVYEINDDHNEYDFFCMNRLVLSLMISKLSKSVDATRGIIMIKLIYIAIQSTNI